MLVPGVQVGCRRALASAPGSAGTSGSRSTRVNVHMCTEARMQVCAEDEPHTGKTSTVLSQPRGPAVGPGTKLCFSLHFPPSPQVAPPERDPEQAVGTGL